MSQLLTGLAVLACPLGMGLMMWMMSRSGRAQNPDNAQTPDNAQNPDNAQALDGAQTPSGAPSSGDPVTQGSGAAEQLAQLRGEVEQLKAQRAEQNSAGGR